MTDDEPSGTRTASIIFWIALVVVAAGALWLRLEYVWTARDGKALGGDGLYYHATANLVADGRGFVNPFTYIYEGRFEQSAEHPPLYSLYLAAFSWLGYTTIHDHLIASALLGTATVVIGAFAGREIGGRVLGIVAAVLLAVYPNVWRHDGMVMSESAAIFATVLCIWFAYRFWWRPSFGRAAALGAAVALAAFARSELAMLTVFLVLPLVMWERDRPFVLRARWLGMAAAGFLALLLPWLAFNYVRFGRPVFLSSQVEVTLAVANCPGTYEGQWKGSWDLTCANKILEDNGIDDATDPRTATVLREETTQYVRDNLDKVPSVVLARWGRLIGVYRTDQQVEVIDTFLEGSTESVARAGVWTLWVMGGFSVLGLVALRVRRIPLTPLVAPLVTVFVTVTLLLAATRFRAPADAALCFLAAAGLVGIGRAALALAMRWRSSGTPVAQDSA